MFKHESHKWFASSTGILYQNNNGIAYTKAPWMTFLYLVHINFSASCALPEPTERDSAKPDILSLWTNQLVLVECGGSTALSHVF